MLQLIPRKKNDAYTSGNKIKLVRGGKEYFDLLNRLIEQAKETIHLQSYIYDDDETGKQVAAALMAAVKKNVLVYLMVDGYASRTISNSFINQLKEAGVQFRFFEPIYRSKYFYFGRRLHHKLVVVDASYAMVGGINITNRYNDMPSHKAWLDFALYVEGEIARELCILCWKTWKDYPRKMGLTPCEEKSLKFEIAQESSSPVRIRRNDWVRRKNQISRSYIEMLQNAQSHITILSSYFLPGSLIKKNLIQAVKRGVKIRVVLAGLSDVIVAKQAERYIYSWLLRNKIEIYEYQGNVLHGKVAVCDDEWMTLGSYNVNNISAYASIELNLDVSNPVFAKKTAETLNDIVTNNCIHITEKTLASSTNIFKRFIRWSSYEFIRLAFYLFTFYFRQKN